MDLKISAPASMNGRISLPASKSISNRMLLISRLAGGRIKLHNISDCDDTVAMEKGVKPLAPTLTPYGKGASPEEATVGGGGAMSSPRGEVREGLVDIGAAGTAMRFLTAYFAATPSDVLLTGTERMLHRPIGVLVDALRSLGADIRYEGEEGFPPLRIRGRQIEGGDIRIAGNVSSQYISALLMVAPTMSRGLTLRMEGEVISRPYIDITTSLMRRFGIKIDEPDDRTCMVSAGEYGSGDYLVENDWSAASYWYEMLALADDGEIVLEGLFEDSLQGDSCVRRLFEPLGIATEFDERGAVLRKKADARWPMANGQCYSADLSHCPDLAQTMVATCCGMGVPFRFSGLQSLRIKETDRLLALRQELAKLGYDVEEENGSVLEMAGLRERKDSVRCSIDTYDDHRMAMCMAPLATLHKGLVINDAQVVSKSYPTFWSDLGNVGYKLEDMTKD